MLFVVNANSLLEQTDDVQLVYRCLQCAFTHFFLLMYRMMSSSQRSLAKGIRISCPLIVRVGVFLSIQSEKNQNTQTSERSYSALCVSFAIDREDVWLTSGGVRIVAPLHFCEDKGNFAYEIPIHESRTRRHPLPRVNNGRLKRSRYCFSRRSWMIQPISSSTVNTNSNHGIHEKQYCFHADSCATVGLLGGLEMLL